MFGCYRYSCFGQGKTHDVDRSAPDLVELPLESIGKYFRPPVDEIGLLPLNDYLQKSGWMDRIVQSRFAPWSKNGKIFGIPHDLHPCSFTYRKDLFDQAGVDLESAQTWDQLQQLCLQFQHYWKNQHQPRIALGLSTTRADMLMIMLRQQHIELVDENLNLHLTDPKVATTLAWYAAAVTGPNQIATDPNPAAGQSAVDLASGDICSLITPDWMIADLKQYGPDLAGKLHMIPLPKFNSDDAPTAAWGGTMIGNYPHLRSSRSSLATHPDSLPQPQRQKASPGTHRHSPTAPRLVGRSYLPSTRSVLCQPKDR